MKGNDLFCGEHPDRTPALLETEHFYVIPAKFANAPGHLMVISKAHYECFGDVPRRLEREFDEVVEVLRQFIRDAYGRDSLVWENGGPISGRSIAHAHLHVIPVDDTAGPMPERIDSLRVSDFGDVRRFWRPGPREVLRRVRVASELSIPRKDRVRLARLPRDYQYVEFRGDRRIIPIFCRERRPMWVWRTAVWNVPLVERNGMVRWNRQYDPGALEHCITQFMQWKQTNLPANFKHLS